MKTVTTFLFFGVFR